MATATFVAAAVTLLAVLLAWVSASGHAAASQLPRKAADGTFSRRACGLSRAEQTRAHRIRSCISRRRKRDCGSAGKRRAQRGRSRQPRQHPAARESLRLPAWLPAHTVTIATVGGQRCTRGRGRLLGGLPRARRSGGAHTARAPWLLTRASCSGVARDVRRTTADRRPCTGLCTSLYRTSWGGCSPAAAVVRVTGTTRERRSDAAASAPCPLRANLSNSARCSRSIGQCTGRKPARWSCC